MPAHDRLTRLLYILPVASREEGVALDEMARALEVDQDTIMRDLEEATARAWYQPAGAIDPFTILIEDGRVTVHAPQDFNRPVRLTQAESLALSLGLRTLAAEAEEPRRGEIMALAARLERELATPALHLRPATVREDVLMMALTPAFEVVVGEDQVRGLLSEAIEARQYCRINYLKPGEAAADRLVAPHSLIYAGCWYLAAHDQGRDEARLFRLDRIAEAQLEHGQFARPDGLVAAEIAQRGFPYVGDDDEVEVTVRYAPRVSRWVLESMPAVEQADGSAIVRHRVSDPDWLIRHVLQFAGDAVVETPELRRAVAAAAARLSA